MKGRQSHFKSRRGCEPCRQRRVKCDEQGPPCAGCAIRRDTTCRFVKRPPRADSVSKKSPAATRTNSSSSTNVTGALPEASVSSQSPDDVGSGGTTGSTYGPLEGDQPTDPELMRQWCVQTSASIVRPAKLDQEVWLGTITDLAFSNDFLMHIILGFSSIHIATQTTDTVKAARYVTKGLWHQTRAFASARKALQNLSASNCDALYAFALINIPCSIISAQLSTSVEEVVQAPTQSVLQCIYSIRTVIYLKNSGIEWLKQGPFADLLAKKYGCTALEYDEAMVAPSNRLRTIHQRYVHTNTSHGVETNIYEPAIETLTHFLIERKNMAKTWLMHTGDEFLVRVEREDEMALMILMHWGVLLNQLETMWWGKWVGKRLVAELATKLEGKHEDGMWAEAICWAREQIKRGILPIDSMAFWPSRFEPG